MPSTKHGRNATAIVLGAWTKRWSAWMALLGVALDVFFQASSGGPEPSISPLNAWLLHAYTCGVIGLVWGLHLHSHLLRQGIGVVPGMRAFHVRISMPVVAAAVLLPVASAVTVGGHPLTLLATTPLPLALGLFAGSASSPNSKGQIAGVAGIAVGALQIPQWAVENSRSGQEPSFFAAFAEHTTLVAATCAVLGIMLLIVLLRGLARAEESSWWFRNRMTRNGGRNSTDCSESMRGMWILRFMPRWAERSVLALRTPEPLELRALSVQWQRTAGPMSPWGLALLGAPIAALLVVMQGQDDPSGVSMFAMIFMTNMLIGLGVNYSRGRLRQEWLRPTSREQLFTGFAWAMARDFAVYSAITWTTLMVSLAVFAPQTLDSVVRIGPLLVSPSVAALGFSTTLIALRTGKFGGALGFAFSALPCGILCLQLAESPWGSHAGTWIVTALAITLVAVALLPVARRSWMRVELGA